MANEVEIVVTDRHKPGGGFDAAENRGKQFSTNMGKIGTVAGGVLAANFAQNAATKILGFFGGMVSEAQEAAKVSASTAQGIKTIGAESWTSADAIGALSESISNKIGVDDELIQQSANLLLTFSKVRNEAGEGNDVFDRATRATQDLAAKGFGSADSAAKMLGKALNDPIKGMTALGRAGVTFTQQQKDQIRSMVEAGDLLGAQKLLLAEVEAQVGGTAEATATSADKMKVAWGNFQENLGKAVMPILNGLFSGLSNVLGVVNNMPAPLQAAAIAVAALGTAGLLLAPRIANTVEALGKMGLTAERIKGSVSKLGDFLGSTLGRSLAIAAGGAALLGIRLASAASGADRFVQNIDKAAGIDLKDRIAALNAELEKQTALQGPNIGGWLYFTDSGKVAGDRVDALKEQIANLEHQQSLQAEASTHEAEALDEGTASAEQQKDAILELVEAHDDFYNVVLGVRDSEREFEAALDSAAEAITDNGKTLDTGTEKGRDNAAALDNIVRATFEHINAMAEDGASLETLGGFMQTARDRFIDLAIKMGLSKDEAIKLADSLGLIPGDYKAFVSAPGASQARGQVEALIDSLTTVTGTPWTVSVNQYGIAGGYASGGIVGPGGGPVLSRQAGGPGHRMIRQNEQGDEIGIHPDGTMIIPAGMSRQIMANGWGGGGGDRPLHVTVDFSGNTDSAFATAFNKLVRDGHIRLKVR